MDLIEFLQRPLDFDQHLECRVSRIQTGLFSKRYALYYENKGLLYSQNKKTNNGSNYYISLEQKDILKNMQKYIGKLRSNFKGTVYNIYSKGEKWMKCNDEEKVRKQLGVIYYKPNLLGSKGPRSLRVLIPQKIQGQDQVRQFIPMNVKVSLIVG